MVNIFRDDRQRQRRHRLQAQGLWLLGALLVLFACGVDDGAAAGRQEAVAPPAVEAVPARSGTLPLEERVSGVVKAENQVAIRAEIEAPIVEVMVRSGDMVQRGQPLVRLEDDALREQLRQAEASLRLAEATAEEARARVAELEARVVRTRRLAEERLVSEMDLETQEAQLAAAKASAAQAEARVEQARASVSERRTALGKTLVRAPVTGRVGQRNAEVGMLADPNTTLFLVGQFDDLIVEVPLTEAMLRYVEEATPIRIDAATLDGEPIRGTISRISPFIEPWSFSTTGEIDVDNRDGRLRPGMFVTVFLLYGEAEEATLVPRAALWEEPRSGRRGVFVVEDAQGLAEAAGPGTDIPAEARPVAFRPVEVVAEGRGRVGIRGVQEGEWVVTVGQHLLHQEAQRLGDGGERGKAVAARVRPTTWEKVLELQGLQREDLLRGFLDKQRRVARILGAEIPESETVVDEALGRDGGSGAVTPDPEATAAAGAGGD